MNEFQFKNKITITLALLLASAAIFGLVSGNLLAAAPEGTFEGAALKARLELKENGPFYIGDSIPVNLIVEGLPGVEYSLPDFEPKQLNGLELVSKGNVEKKVGKEGWKHTIAYRFIGWQVGEYKISGLTVSYHDHSNNKGSVTVEELQLKITSVLPANLSEAELLADGLKYPKKPVGLPPRYQYIGTFLGGLGLLGLVYLLLRHWRNSYRSKSVAVDEQKLKILEPAHLIALRKLDDLRRERLLEAGNYKSFYDKLSEIAREYLENRFQFRALEMTTEEFLMSLGRMDFLSLSQKNILAEFLQYSDLVKFAKHQPLKNEGEKALNMVQGLIEETKEEVDNDI